MTISTLVTVPRFIRLRIRPDRAILAVQSWRFKPATKNGRPVSCRIRVPFDYYCTPLFGSSNVFTKDHPLMHVYKVRPRKDKRGFDLISDAHEHRANAKGRFSGVKINWIVAQPRTVGRCLIG